MDSTLKKDESTEKGSGFKKNKGTDVTQATLGKASVQTGAFVRTTLNVEGG